jgi:hypothetical protein
LPLIAMYIDLIGKFTYRMVFFRSQTRDSG